MQFSLLAFTSLLALTLAAPTLGGVQEKRAPLPQVASEAPAMSNANGDVVPFSSAQVVQPLKNAGQ